MPTDETILGFGNRWYKQAIEFSSLYPLTKSLEIRVVTAPYFLATKFEAFKTSWVSKVFAVSQVVP